MRILDLLIRLGKYSDREIEFYPVLYQKYMLLYRLECHKPFPQDTSFTVVLSNEEVSEHAEG